MSDREIEDIEKVVVHLLRNDGVFYAYLLFQMKRIPNTEFPFAAGVTVKNGYIEMYWNPEKFKEMKDIKEKASVLEHECQHLVKNHIGRLGNKDMKLWNIAADLAINQFIKNLPDWVYTLDKFPASWKMHKNKPAEYYYNQLKKHQQSIEFSKGADGKMKATIKNSDGSVAGEIELDAPGNHDKWEEGEGADGKEIVEEVVRQTVKKALEQTERMQGTVPGNLQDDINEILKPAKIPWQRLLRRWVGNKVKASSRYSIKRPNRRYGMTQKGKVPVRKLQITLAIDTSGSISDENLQEFMIEIHSIMASYKSTITVIECDWSVQKVYKLKPHTKVDPKFKGRGGTSFKPPFEKVSEDHIETELMIYFTDLWGDFPDKPPRYPTLWVVVDDPYYSQSFKPPFGEVVKLTNLKNKVDNFE
jgi:predicted metal-dependent peptidase